MRLRLQPYSKGTITLTETTALSAIGNCSRALKEQGLIGHAPNARDLLELLASHHLLVKTAYMGDPDIRFVHQQFQEWFAAEWLYKRLIETIESPHENAAFSFQREILNNLAWEESLKFLAERLNSEHRQEAGSRYGDELVRLTMPVDSIFAAQLARLVGWGTLTEGREELSAALRKWYARPEGPHKECAIAAMLATGSSDFLDVFTPLIENDDRQLRLRFYCVWKPFPLSCLGDDWLTRFTGWPEDRRAEFVHEMMWDADASHHRLASHLSQDDPSSAVRAAALEMLAWSGAFETLMTVLERESYTWPAEKSLRFLEVIPKRYLHRIVPRIKNVLSSMTVPEARYTLLQLLDEISNPDAVTLMKQEMDHEVPSRTVSMLLPRLHIKDPAWVAEWVGKKMIEGEFWEEELTEYLNGASPELLSSIGKAASDNDLDLNTFARRLRVFSKVAPDIIAQILLPEFLEKHIERLRSRTLKNERDREDILHTALRELPYPALVRATLDIKNSLMDSHSVEAILDVLTRHSAPFEQDVKAILSPVECAELKALIFIWDQNIPPLEHDRGGRRAYLAALLGAIGKPEDAAVLEQWSRDDLIRERETHRTMRQANIRWTTWYAGALARLKCDEAATVLVRLLSEPEYLEDASSGLLHIARTEEETAQARISFWPDYRNIWQTRQKRITRMEDSQANTRRAEYAGAIHKALTARLDERQKFETPVFLPPDLSRAAMALAHLDEEDCIPILIRCGSHEALEVLVLKGIILSGADILDVLDPIITEIENEPRYSNQDCWYVIERCLSILLFSNSPALGVERIRRIPSRLLNSYRTKNLIRVLGLCRAPEAAEFLTGLIGNHDVLRHCMWEYVHALAESRQPQSRGALIRLLDELGEGSISGGYNRHDTVMGLGDALAKVSKEDREIWSEIRSRCEGSLNREQREALFWTLEKLGTEEAALAACLLPKDELGVHMGHLRIYLLEEALFYRVEAGTPSSYYLQPKPANALRKCLMEQVLHDPTRQNSSLALLAEIETRRLDLGKPPDEPRHPDIATLLEIHIPWHLINTE